MRTKYKAWAKPFLDEHLEVSLTNEELSSSSSIYLEIGSGKGQFLRDMALKYPERIFIGIERNVTCAGFTAKKLVESEIKNAHIIFDDAERVLDLFPPKSVKIIYLNFSDPWPKVRHHKRRLTSDRFCALYQKVLEDDGYIIQKTDNEELFDFSKETFLNHNFIIFDEDRNYMTSEDDVVTEYEADFRKENLPIYRMKVKMHEGK